MADAFLNTIDSVLDATDELLQESQQESGSSARYVLSIISKFQLHVLLPKGKCAIKRQLKVNLSL